ncbi:MAG: ergothioneine biosynthesis protein EgtB [Halioglobus sp.]|nr:ergothioneine biosynthesis protein EgtB [Halioglobus sp.]
MWVVAACLWVQGLLVRSPDLLQRYRWTRQRSMQACEMLHVDDYGLQAAPFVSPPKWHLAHTSWFFETFLLEPFLTKYRAFNAQYSLLFNSYYNGIGEQYARSQRCLLSRPTIDEVVMYREHVDAAMVGLLEAVDHPQRLQVLSRTRLGLEHEQQHQELFYTDLKYSLFANPLLPAYSDAASPESTTVPLLQQQRWCEYTGGLVVLGVDPQAEGFAFDNERPAARVYLEPFQLSNRLVTNAEYQDFVDDGGYQTPRHWLADGWAVAQEARWHGPLYWLQRDGELLEFTLCGLRKRNPDAPVCHLSGYEADAYANWASARLPTEFEWEHAALQQEFVATEFDPQVLHPRIASTRDALVQLYSDCWQWTGSAYRPYSGFTAGDGAIGEYNGKFMANQWVLRGGSCVSQTGHVRPTYRNFFYPRDRWQFSGLRLARES